MLAALSIRDIVIIDRLDVSFTSGLSVLTGETGAGKSILLDAFSLALGGRGDSSLVREGCEQGQVTAAFDLPLDHPAFRLLEENGLDADGGLILRRLQSADGRTRAFVNDQPASVQTLKALGASLVEIHGQHDDRALVDPATHRRLLDAYGGLHGEVAETGRRWRAWRAAEDGLAKAREALERSEAEREFLAHAVDELDKLSPEAGEEERLAERRHLMMQGEKLADELNDAMEATGGTGGGPAVLIAGALRRLERRAEQLPALVEPVVAALDKALLSIEEARSAVERALGEAAFDPRELEEAEERLFALRALARKHRVSVDDLPALHDKMRAELSAIADGGERVSRLEKDAAEARSACETAAAALTECRRKAALALDAAVAAELAPLKLDQAQFETRVERSETSGPEGADTVEFWVRTNPGARPGPLLKVASGGELSRFMLALKVALADKGSAPTLVFDEIDTAVGGAVSDAIGARLARLAEKVQVLSVTHAPQVAARATSHLRIAKEAAAGEERVATRVEPLDDERRREEIARMLAGATVTDEARAAAGRLLAGAG